MRAANILLPTMLVLLFAKPAAAVEPIDLAAPPSIAPANFLQPDDTNFADYRSSEARVFKDVFDKAVLARVIVEPSFEREYAIAVVAEGDGYKLFMLEPSDQIWQYTVLEMMKEGAITSTDDKGKSTTAAEIDRLEAELPPNPEDLKVARCEIHVPEYIGDRILDSWKLMLASTHPSDTMGIDGTSYHFAARDNDRMLAGETWSPMENTNPYRLVMLMIVMRDACRTRSAAPLSSIAALADAIRANRE